MFSKSGSGRSHYICHASIAKSIHYKKSFRETAGLACANSKIVRPLRNAYNRALRHVQNQGSPSLPPTRGPRVPTASQVTAAWAGLAATQADLNRSVRKWKNDTEQTWDPLAAPGTIDAHRPPPPRFPSTPSSHRRRPRALSPPPPPHTPPRRRPRALSRPPPPHTPPRRRPRALSPPPPPLTPKRSTRAPRHSALQGTSILSYV